MSGALLRSFRSSRFRWQAIAAFGMLLPSPLPSVVAPLESFQTMRLTEGISVGAYNGHCPVALLPQGSPPAPPCPGLDLSTVHEGCQRG